MCWIYLKYIHTITIASPNINSSSSSASYLHQWTGSAAVQVMACHLFNAKPLPEPMLPFCQLDLLKTSVKFESKYKTFHSWKWIWKCHLGNGRRFSPVNSPHKGQWRGALMFSLICTWINGWVNNHEAGDLRRHHAHYEAIVMSRRWVRNLGPVSI